jgi:hypothetical protein
MSKRNYNYSIKNGWPLTHSLSKLEAEIQKKWAKKS